MKFIAHRGACLEAQEDTLQSLELGAGIGAYAVECDPRYTKDGVAVLFHDDDLMRLAGNGARVEDITYSEMKDILSRAGKTLTTLDKVLKSFSGRCAVLFDMKDADEDLLKRIANAPFRAIAGIRSIETGSLAAKYFAPENLLAFMPKPEMASDFARNGAGIIRLWEHWLDGVSVADVRAQIPADREIWIMSNDKSIKDPLLCMSGSRAQVEKIIKTGADGMLLNDIRMAVSL